MNHLRPAGRLESDHQTLAALGRMYPEQLKDRTDDSSLVQRPLSLRAKDSVAKIARHGKHHTLLPWPMDLLPAAHCCKPEENPSPDESHGSQDCTAIANCKTRLHYLPTAAVRATDREYYRPRSGIAHQAHRPDSNPPTSGRNSFPATHE